MNGKLCPELSTTMAANQAKRWRERSARYHISCHRHMICSRTLQKRAYIHTHTYTSVTKSNCHNQELRDRGAFDCCSTQLTLSQWTLHRSDMLCTLSYCAESNMRGIRFFWNFQPLVWSSVPGCVYLIVRGLELFIQFCTLIDWSRMLVQIFFILLYIFLMITSFDNVNWYTLFVTVSEFIYLRIKWIFNMRI